MAKKKNFDSQTNPVKCKSIDREILNKMFLNLRNRYYLELDEKEIKNFVNETK